MKFFHSLTAAVALLAALTAAPPAEVINLPPVPAPAPPTPPTPPPGTPIKLQGAVVYDFYTTAPCVVRSYPANLLTVTSSAIPANETFRDSQSFFDGATQRVYKGPCTVYNVRAAGVGRVVMVITPEKTDSASKDIREVLFDVDNGTKPIPPPEPIPPEPVPPTPVVVTSFHSLIVYDPNFTYPPKQYGIIFGLDVENAEKAACNLPGASAWRRISNKADPATLPAGLKEVWTVAKPLVTSTPCLVFQVNEKITLEPLPATVADTTAMIAKYRSGK